MPKLRLIVVLSIIGCCGSLFAPSINATLIAYTDAGATHGSVAGNLNIGREFTVGGNGIQITSLGVFDDGSNGLVNSHDVTLFSINGSGANPAPETELATVNIPSGTTAQLLDGFRFESIPSINLAPGNYAVVAYGMNASGGDAYGDGGSTPSFPPFLTQITFDPYEFSAATNPSWPSLQGDNGNHSSTSFLFNPVPEPSSYALCAIGAVGLFSAARRRRRA